MLIETLSVMLLLQFARLQKMSKVLMMLEPKGVAVVMNAKHQCMTTRGVHKPESSTITSTMLGAFRENTDTRAEFMNLITTSS